MKTKSKKIIFPSEDWIYFKIYLNSDAVDSLLSKKVLLTINKLKSENLINKWFFIRYTDEFGFHLRIRFECNNYYLSVMELFLKGLKDKAGFEAGIKKIQIDTYEKETERYGSDTIYLVEKFFCRDSELIIKEISRRVIDPNRRWLFAISLISYYLKCLNYDYAFMSDLMARFAKPYFNRFNPNTTTFSQINSFYNTYKEEIKDACKNPNEILGIGMHSIETVLLELNKILSDRHSGSFEELLGDLIHMSLNRVFPSDANHNEYIIYEFLKKAYKALQITEEKVGKNISTTR